METFKLNKKFHDLSKPMFAIIGALVIVATLCYAAPRAIAWLAERLNLVG